jgi:hypothetical protein
MGKVQTLKKAKAVSFGDVLSKTAKTKPTKPSKSKMPTVQPPPEIAKAVDDYQEAKAASKEADAVIKHSGQIIEDFVRGVQDEDGFAGKFNNSYALQGNKSQAKISFSNRWTINAEDAPELEEILGEHFDNFLTRNFSVKLKSEVFENEELQSELMELIGERFDEFFETTLSLTPCEDLTRNLYRLDREALVQFRTFARQYKPSIR